MRRRLVVAPSARTDLHEIRDYLSNAAGNQVAARVIRAIYEAMTRLADGTAIGHARHDLADDPVRFYLVFRYFLVFQAASSELLVFRLLHTARDVKAILS